jgi:hypothetical protein
MNECSFRAVARHSGGAAWHEHLAIPSNNT